VPGCLSKAERWRAIAAVAVAGLLAGCAAGPKPPPYPAFVRVDALPDVFLAALPGSRAKQLAGDPESRRSSNLVVLPPDWSFGTGASPDKSLEIYVLAGRLRLGELTLEPGGYAFVPAGNFGMTLATDGGARILYFLDAANPASVIQTPMILHRDQIQWQPLSEDPADRGTWIKELRADPGSGARTWLTMVEPGATVAWRRASVAEEGLLLEGSYRHSECVDGQAYTGSYEPIGYYYRPPEALHGGPDSGADGNAVWFVRRLASASVSTAPGCLP